MTIDVVETLTKYKQNLIIRDRGQYSDKSVAECSNLTMKEVVECLDFAIATMCKYQKLESKIKVLQHFTEDTPLATQRMIRIVNEISEVLEDGNDD